MGNSMRDSTLRQKLGALVYDMPRFAGAMRRRTAERATAPWVFMRNRHEKLEPGPDMQGARCRWQWTSRLHIADVFGWAGRSLMRRALEDWPIVQADRPSSQEGSPDISFVIGHRGRERLPLLLATLRSIAGQSAVRPECIVVEQSPAPEVKQDLPSWVRYVHDASPAELPYNRARTFNMGARVASSHFLVFHDNDMLVPRDYSIEMLRLAAEGWEVINLKRFIFYLDETTTQTIVSGTRRLSAATPMSVIQNAEGGGTLGCSRSAFVDIGCWDDEFVGWGGEDNEFWERAVTRRFWPYAYCPFVHLWHEDQPGKTSGDADGTTRYQAMTERTPAERIEALLARTDRSTAMQAEQERF